MSELIDPLDQAARELDQLLSAHHNNLQGPALATACMGIPFGSIGTAQSGTQVFDFGVLLQAWARGQLVETCPACGATQSLLIFKIGGSVLSGHAVWSGFCLACREHASLGFATDDLPKRRFRSDRQPDPVTGFYPGIYAWFKVLAEIDRVSEKPLRLKLSA